MKGIRTHSSAAAYSKSNESVCDEALTSYDHPQGGTMGLPANVYIDVRQRDEAP
jgi:hypothetical protein